MPKIRLETSPDRYRIVLDDPPLHILDIGMLEELREALGTIRPDRSLLVIESTGEKAFSAGASVQDHLGERVRAMLGAFHAALASLARLELVTVAKVRGVALGGGCELALACDFVLAAENAMFGVPEIRLGVFPPVAAWQLARQIPPRKGLELVLTGDPIGARGAERLGMINAVLPTARFDAECESWLERLLRHSGSSLRIARKAFRLAQAGDFEATLERIEKLYLDELMETEDATEGLKAFLAKRPPVWKNG